MTTQELLTKIKGTPFEADLTKGTLINGKQSSIGYYNLIVSIRDCSLYSKGIKPHRFWKISNVKKYFGIKGTAESMANQLREIRDCYK